MSINPSPFAQICVYTHYTHHIKLHSLFIAANERRRHNGVAMFYGPNQMTTSNLFLFRFVLFSKNSFECWKCLLFSLVRLIWAGNGLISHIFGNSLSLGNTIAVSGHR